MTRFELHSVAEFSPRSTCYIFGAISAIVGAVTEGIGDVGAALGFGAADAGAAGAAGVGAGADAAAAADLGATAGGIGGTAAGAAGVGAGAAGGAAADLGGAAALGGGATDLGADFAGANAGLPSVTDFAPTGALNTATGTALPAGTASSAAAPGAAGAGAGGAGVSAGGIAAPAGVGGDSIVLDSGPPLDTSLGGSSSSLGSSVGGANFGAVPGDSSLAALQGNASLGEAGLPTASGSDVLSGAASSGGASLGTSSGPTSFFEGLFGTGGNTPSALGAAINNPTWGNIGAAVGANSGTILSAGGLGLSALEGLKEPPGYSNIESTAGELAGQGRALSNYINTGTLPPGMQASINQAGADAAATIRSQYAARGMSGSSAEAQDLANVQTTMSSQAANIAMNLLSQGVSEENVSSQLYNQLMQVAMQQDQDLSNAVTGFAVAAAGGNQPIILRG